MHPLFHLHLRNFRHTVIALSLMVASTFFSWPTEAAKYNCFGLNEGCTNKRATKPANNSSQVRINPSAVPTEEGFGIEGIFFKNEVDVSLVRGNGRVGAAISPSNSESTFFGPPAIELLPDFYDRKRNSTKYPAQKYTLAAAMNIIDKNGSGFNRYAVKIGLMGKYNKVTKATTPGGGLSAILGPFSLGYAIYDDQTQLDYGKSYNNPEYVPQTEVIKYQVQTYNFGFYLNSLILDYSNLHMRDSSSATTSSVYVYTASFILGRFLLTAAHRIEDSNTPYYNYDTQLTETKQIKEDSFGGIQFTASKNIMVGFLYNYYLLHETSASLTLFF